MVLAPLGLVQAFVAALNSSCGAGGADPSGYLSGDVEIDIAGKSPISGLYRGMDQVRGVLVSTIKRRVAKFNVIIVDTIVEGEALAVKLVISGLSAANIPINPDSQICGAFVVTEGDKIKKITLIPDTDELMSVVFGLTTV